MALVGKLETLNGDIAWQIPNPQDRGWQTKKILLGELETPN